LFEEDSQLSAAKSQLEDITEQEKMFLLDNISSLGSSVRL